MSLIWLSLTPATDRLSFTLETPFEYGARERAIEHNFMVPPPGGNGNPPHRYLHTMRAGGPGDPRIRADYWLLDPKKSPDRNISFGIDLKIPVVVDDAEDYSYRATGKILRPVSIALQPSDGGWGIILGTHAFSTLYFPNLPQTNWLKNFYTYADAIYVFSP